MPLNMDDADKIRRMIIDPVVSAVKLEFHAAFDRHDERLKRVEAGQIHENEILDGLDKRMGAMEKWKAKIAIVYGVIAAAVTMIVSLVKDRFMAWIRKH